MAVDDSGSLRDVISEAFDKAQAPGTPDAPVETPQAAAETPAAEPATPEGERARDPETGRYVAQEKTPETPKAAPAAPAPTPKHSIPRPSSWAKDYWNYWDGFDEKLAKYVQQRESEYAKGVSTYKGEYDRLKPLGETLNAFAPHIQRMGIKPEQFVQNLGNAHVTLATGTPEQKLSMFLKIAQDYGVNLQSLFVRGQDGQVYYNPQVPAYQPPQQQQAPQQDVTSVVRDILSQETAKQQLAEFESQAAEKYQHYEAVRETMAQLLDAGFVKTLPEAYTTALRMPQHADLFAQAQQAEAEKAKAEAARKAQEEAARAKAKAVSTRGQTPQGKGSGAKGNSVRDALEAAYEQHMPEARV